MGGNYGVSLRLLQRGDILNPRLPFAKPFLNLIVFAVLKAWLLGHRLVCHAHSLPHAEQLA
jgi:hypothetical protein